MYELPLIELPSSINSVRGNELFFKQLYDIDVIIMVILLGIRMRSYLLCPAGFVQLLLRDHRKERSLIFDLCPSMSHP